MPFSKEAIRTRYESTPLVLIDVPSLLGFSSPLLVSFGRQRRGPPRTPPRVRPRSSRPRVVAAVFWQHRRGRRRRGQQEDRSARLSPAAASPTPMSRLRVARDGGQGRGIRQVSELMRRMSLSKAESIVSVFCTYPVFNWLPVGPKSLLSGRPGDGSSFVRPSSDVYVAPSCRFWAGGHRMRNTTAHCIPNVLGKWYTQSEYVGSLFQ